VVAFDAARRAEQRNGGAGSRRHRDVAGDEVLRRQEVVNVDSSKQNESKSEERLGG
jgi:hypothetical protein